MPTVPAASKRRVVGRYELYDSIASGGMATIHLGRLLGEVGFARVVAIKKLHPHLATDPEFSAMLLDEARLAAGISHPNVVPTLDVVATEGEIFLIMDYVEGDSLSHLIRFTRKSKQLIEPAIVSGVMSGALYGLHAAHTAVDERGKALNIVHRDFSPQNILVGVDGIPRVLDFGVAKAARRIAQTEAGRTKGKFSYMAPEQIRMDNLDLRADIFSAGICAWEALTGRLLFSSEDPGRTIAKVIECNVPPPSSIAPNLSASIDAIVLRALNKDPSKRFQTAREMAIALEDAIPPAIPRKIGEWVEHHAGEMLRGRSARLAEVASDHASGAPATKQELRARIQTREGERPAAPAPQAKDESAQSKAPAAATTLPLESPAPAMDAPPFTGGDNDIDDATTQISDSFVGPSELLPRDAPPPSSADFDEAVATRIREPASNPSVSSGLVGREPASNPNASAGFVGSNPTPAGFQPVPSDAKTPISHVSEMSVASYAGPPRQSMPPKAPLIALAAIVLGLAVAMVIGLFVFLRAEPETAEVGPSADPAAAAAKPPEPASTVLEPNVDPTPTESADAPKPSASGPPEPPPEVASKPKSEADPTKRPAATTPPIRKPPVKADCDPPYTVENGIKKFKRHCM